MRWLNRIAPVVLAASFAHAAIAQDLKYAFSYQGLLTESGSRPTGLYDMKFSLWSDSSGGSQFTAIGGDGYDVHAGGEAVQVTDGLFTVLVNDGDEEFGEFGELAFWGVSDRWLQVEVRLSDGSGDPYQTLSQRQRLSTTPFSALSLDVGAPMIKEEDSEQTLFCFTNLGIGGVGKFISLNPFASEVSLYTSTEGPLSAFEALTNGAGLALRATATAGGRAGLFEIAQIANPNTALEVLTIGSGTAFQTSTSGSGAALLAQTSGGGSAAVIDILNGANGNPALEVTTAGSGSALRAVGSSGFGILAESDSGIGLRATSMTGTAMEVAGTSTFSAAAAFNGATPFTVANSTLIPNLNAGLFDGRAGPFYRDASNLNAGTLDDNRLSLNIARLGSPQTFTGINTFSNASNIFAGDGAGLTSLNASQVTSGTLGDGRLSNNVALRGASQTFSGANVFANPANSYAGDGGGLTGLNADELVAGTVNDERLPGNLARLDRTQIFTSPNTFSQDATVNARLTINANSVQSATQITNVGGGPAADFGGDVGTVGNISATGNLHAGGDLTKQYSGGITHPAAPIAYAFINSNGTVASGTDNVSCVLLSSPDLYEITITGESYTNQSYVTVVTPQVPNASPPVIATTGAVSGKLRVKLRRPNGDFATESFQFVTYKP